MVIPYNECSVKVIIPPPERGRVGEGVNAGSHCAHAGYAPNGEFSKPDQADATCPVLASKINRFAFCPNQIHKRRRPVLLTRGVSRSSRTLGAGCGGRGRAEKTNGVFLRTAKSCGPDAPTLASSGPRCFGIVACDGGKQARSPGRARRKPLKPFACGNAG
jgi:hypothetical protein